MSVARFTDSRGRQWCPVLTAGLLREVRLATGMDVGRMLLDPDGTGRILFEDPGALVDVLWVLCRADAVSRGVDPNAFADGFDADVMEPAVGALLAAVDHFFPEERPDPEGPGTERPGADLGGTGLEELCWQLAGLTGLDPYTLGLRELLWAAAGAWDTTSVLLASLCAMMPGGKKVDAEELNPFRTPRTRLRPRPPVSEAESAAAWAVLDNYFQAGRN